LTDIGKLAQTYGPENVSSLLNALSRGATTAGIQRPTMTETPRLTTTPTKTTLSDAQRKRLLDLRERLQPTASATQPPPVSKQTEVTAAPISTVLEQKPPVIRAIAWQESRYNPKAVGPKTKAGQAKGVMQLTDATAKSLGVADPFNPEENINAGERYYNKLLKQFGNRELALAAYNWGEGNLRKALRKVAAQEVKPTWANVLQYAYVPKETRSYVKSIVNKMKEFEV